MYTFEILQKDSSNHILTCTSNMSETELHEAMTKNSGPLCSLKAHMVECSTIINKQMGETLGFLPVGATFYKFRFEPQDWSKVRDLGVGDIMKENLCFIVNKNVYDDSDNSDAEESGVLTRGPCAGLTGKERCRCLGNGKLQDNCKEPKHKKALS